MDKGATKWLITAPKQLSKFEANQAGSLVPFWWVIQDSHHSELPKHCCQLCIGTFGYGPARCLPPKGLVQAAESRRLTKWPTNTCTSTSPAPTWGKSLKWSFSFSAGVLWSGFLWVPGWKVSFLPQDQLPLG